MKEFLQPAFIIAFFLGNFMFAQVSYEVAFPNLNFDFMVELQHADDDSDRIFVVEQTGRIMVFPNTNSVLPSEQNIFLDISQEINYSSGQEIGLLGLAFHPEYASNGYFFVYYTRASTLPEANSEIVLSRFTVSDNPNNADVTSKLEIFSFHKNQLDSNHNGGKIAFGPDGYLYVSVGDGGGAGDPNDNAQNLLNIFGSILRIDVDLDGNNPLETNPALPNGNYEIPSDNPRVGLDGLDELYSWGLRNTWKFSFDNTTGYLWGADVGQGDFEEINLISNGGNYGWDRFEANSISDSATALATDNDIAPVFYYNHDQGDVSITGGYVYRGSSTDPLLSGKYIYGDYVSGRVWSLDYDMTSGTATSSLLFRTDGQFISSFGLDQSGELYFSDYGRSKQLYRLSGSATNSNPSAVEGIGSWENLENGIDGVVNAVATSGNNLTFFGGAFDRVDGIYADDIAAYRPDTGWIDLGSGTNGSVNAIVISSDDTVYIGGSFSVVDNIPANNIAMWDGSTWSALGEGTDGPVQALHVDSENTLWVGGNFQNAGGFLVRNVAQWTGSEWLAMTDATSGIQGTNNEVRAIAVGDEAQVYIGGNFDNAGGNYASRIAIWDGNSWNALGTGTSGFVQAILVTDEYVYAGGNFSLAGNRTVNRIARWSTSNLEWQNLGDGVSGNVNSLEHDGTYLFVGGSFETASDITEAEKVVRNIARWDSDSGWKALGSASDVGVDIQVNDLCLASDAQRLFVGGNFSSAGAIEAANVALWYEAEQPTEIADDNFTITTIDNDCPESNNGSIIARANQPADYNLVLSSGSQVSTYEFTELMEIKDLPPATYEITITAEGFPEYNANYQATIAAPELLEVSSQLDDSAKTLTLNMSGGSTYIVQINDSTINTTENMLVIDLTDTINAVKVSTELACQGTFEETFMINIVQSEEFENQNIVLQANPISKTIRINFPNQSEGETIYAEIFAISGEHLLSQLQKVENSTIAIDTEILAEGIYIVRLEFSGFTKSFRIIKL